MSRRDIRTEHLGLIHQLVEGDALSEKAKKKLRAILHYLESDVSMEEAAAAAGVTSGALRRWIDAFDPEDPRSLEEKSRRPRTVRSSDIGLQAATLIRSYRQTSPRMGKEEIARVLAREHGETVSASAVGRFIARECLYFADCPLHRRKRLRFAMKGSPAGDTSSSGTAAPATGAKPASSRRWQAAKRWVRSGLFIVLPFLVILIGIMTMNLTRAYAAPGPTLLVNTEAFSEISDGPASSDIELRFGTSGKVIRWDFSNVRFDFSDDIHVDGNVTGSGGLAIEQNIRAKGNLTLNSDNDTNNAVLTFGNGTLAQSLSFVDADQSFRFSAGVEVAGSMSGQSLTISNLLNCDTIDTDANGVLVCGTDAGAGGGITMADGDARYVRSSGDTMTGALIVQNGNTHTPTSSPLLNVRGTLSGALLRAANMTTQGAVVYSSGSILRQTAQGSSGQLLLSQGSAAPKWGDPVGGMMWYFDGTQAVATGKGPQITMPFGLTLTSISLNAKGAPTGADLIYDINVNGTTIFSTRPQIDAGATTGGGSAVFSTVNVPANSTLTIDIDQVGSTFAGSGVTVMLKGIRNY